MTREQEKAALVKSIETQIADFCKKHNVKLRGIWAVRPPHYGTSGVYCTGEISLEFFV